MILETIVNGSRALTSFSVTLHNEVDDGDEPIEAWLIGNVLLFQVINDRALRPEESDNLYFYRVTDEQRSKLLSYAPGERDISVEWVYVHGTDASKAPLLPHEYYELNEEEAEQYSLELDVSI